MTNRTDGTEIKTLRDAARAATTMTEAEFQALLDELDMAETLSCPLK